jgi:phosphomannomutase
MAETNAVFGGEHSGHFYFRDFWRADSGMLAALHTLAALGETSAEVTLSALLKSYIRYVESGEINSTVGDARAVMDSIKAIYSENPLVSIDELDGLTIAGENWWFNVRASNTEPLLRLNAEAPTKAEVDAIVEKILKLIRA